MGRAHKSGKIIKENSCQKTETGFQFLISITDFRFLATNFHMNLKRILISKPIIILEVLVLGYFMFNVGQEMLKKQGIEAEISHLENEIGKLEKDKNDLNALLSYVQTDAFVEQEAREKLNLAKDGESLVLLPEADSTGFGAPTPQEGIVDNYSQSVETPVKKSNLVKWWQYFFEHERLALE